MKDMRGSIEVDIEVGIERGEVETEAESEIGTPYLLRASLLLGKLPLVCNNCFVPSAGVTMVMTVRERGGTGEELAPDLVEGLEIVEDHDHDLGLEMIEGKVYSFK